MFLPITRQKSGGICGELQEIEIFELNSAVEERKPGSVFLESLGYLTLYHCLSFPW